MEFSHGTSTLVSCALVGTSQITMSLHPSCLKSQGAVSDAVQETTEFFENFSDSPFTTEIMAAITNVVSFTEDVVEDIAEEVSHLDFNETSWSKLVDDAKYVIHSLPDTVSNYIAIGTHAHFLSLC